MIGLARSIDKYVGSFLVNAIGLFRRDRRFYEAKRILVVKLWAMGDSIVLLPMLEGLRKNFPKAEIDVLANGRNADVFYANKDINNVLLFEGKNLFKLIRMFNDYDLVIDAEPYLNISALLSWYIGKFTVGFSHAARSKLYDVKTSFSKNQHMVQNYLDMIRALGAHYDTNKLVKLNYSDADRHSVEQFLQINGVSKRGTIVGISPGVAESVKARMWPLEKVAALADRIIESTGAKVMFVDVKDNIPLVEKIISIMKRKDKIINATGRFGKKAAFCLIERCDAFVSNDAGNMHAAAAQGVKTVGLFGPNTPVLWAPYGKQNISIYRPPSTGPFIDNARGYMPSKLTQEQANCMDQITVDEVFKAVKRLLR